MKKNIFQRDLSAFRFFLVSALISVSCFADVVHVVLSNLGYVSSAWLSWSHQLLVRNIFLSFAFFLAVSRDLHFLRATLLVNLILSVWAFVDLIVVSHHLNRQIIEYSPAFGLGLTGYVLINFFYQKAFFYFKSLKKENLYSKDGVFITYSAPRNAFELIFSLFTGGFFSASVVHKGIQYTYSGGKIVKRPYVARRYHYYKKTEKWKKEELEKLLGGKWSIRRNCFAVFSR